MYKGQDDIEKTQPADELTTQEAVDNTSEENLEESTSTEAQETPEITPKERAARDKVFYDELFPQADALYNFAYHLALDESRARDLVQETFLKAYRAIASYQPGTNAKAWLFRILKNAFINEYRKKSKRPKQVDFEDVQRYVEDDTIKPASTDGFKFNNDAFSGMMGDEVTMAINNLPVDFRTTLLLCDVEDFTYEEIAAIMDIPIGTVRSRLFRARNLLKNQLKAYAKSMGYDDVRGSRNKTE